MSPRFDLQLDRERYAPGEVIHGRVNVLEGGGSRSLQVVLGYHEKTDDYSAVATTIPGPVLNEGDLRAGMAFDFELRLSSEAFPNLRSNHGELYWELDVKSDEFGRDTHIRRRIEVSSPPR
jgi:hypothetical protein